MVAQFFGSWKSTAVMLRVSAKKEQINDKKITFNKQFRKLFFTIYSNFRIIFCACIKIIENMWTLGMP